MGIKQLLPQLKDITTDATINSYRGKRVGVDAYVWLHQKAFSCATELCLKQSTDSYVHSFLSEVHFLQQNGVIPVIVFDGGFLPCKAKVEAERALSRKQNLKEGRKLYRNGSRKEAFDYFTKAVDITPQMAYEVICHLKQMNVEFIVAPYEADAQLAYLYRTGHIFAVISIDSDLLVFGCQRLLTKYRKGFVKEVNLRQLQHNRAPLNFCKFNFEMFVQFCIFCGCDYLDSIKGIGPSKAHAYMLSMKKWQKALQRIRFDGKCIVPKEYQHGYQKALYTFRHQRVYDPTQKKLVHLQPLPPDMDLGNTDFLGPDMESTVAQQVAEGIIDPITRQPFQSQFSAATTSSKPSKWLKRKKKSKSSSSQSNTMLSYLLNSKVSPSPPPPATLLAKKYERHKQMFEQMQLKHSQAISSSSASGSSSCLSQQQQQHQPPPQAPQQALQAALVQPASAEKIKVNAIANYQRLDAFSFGNQKQDAIVLSDDDDDDDNNNELQLPQTQQTDKSIRDRHLKRTTAPGIPAKRIHKFKKVLPKKGIHKVRRDNDDARKRNRTHNTNEALHDRMSQFAFGAGAGGVARNVQQIAANNSRKRRRSQERSLLPSRPTSSVDYNNDRHAAACDPKLRRRRRDIDLDLRSNKKRKLITTYRTSFQFESPFIPKQTRTLALCNNSNVIPQCNLSSFAFAPSIDRNHKTFVPETQLSAADDDDENHAVNENENENDSDATQLTQIEAATQNSATAAAMRYYEKQEIDREIEDGYVPETPLSPPIDQEMDVIHANTNTHARVQNMQHIPAPTSLVDVGDDDIGLQLLDDDAVAVNMQQLEEPQEQLQDDDDDDETVMDDLRNGLQEIQSPNPNRSECIDLTGDVADEIRVDERYAGANDGDDNDDDEQYPDLFAIAAATGHERSGEVIVSPDDDKENSLMREHDDGRHNNEEPSLYASGAALMDEVVSNEFVDIISNEANLSLGDDEELQSQILAQANQQSEENDSMFLMENECDANNGDDELNIDTVPMDQLVSFPHCTKRRTRHGLNTRPILRD
eukprot:CAMPEP_0202708586 /NCGR_PEP_ID=MMETSP1385-20130828/20756_1 /ASSEMBLY_ACC=CAM_ASM_000861 /TAXON_ID=933848 /ORGANISM="Elphidium margaritaceum" /LENGTH=1036 /DNA_ID=CAMNT_0049367593 /DNA_START=62 /DNA_END=3169 /DNA_ORIENTATION=+